MHGVSAALASRQINKANLAIEATIMFEHHLHDSMRAGTFRISACLTTCSQAHANLERVHYRVNIVDLNLCQVDDIDDLFAIFAAVDGCSVVKQIEELSTVDLIEGKVELEVRVHVQVLDDVIGG